jgi:hypothetical protein
MIHTNPKCGIILRKSWLCGLSDTYLLNNYACRVSRRWSDARFVYLCWATSSTDSLLFQPSCNLAAWCQIEHAGTAECASSISLVLWICTLMPEARAYSFASWFDSASVKLHAFQIFSFDWHAQWSIFGARLVRFELAARTSSWSKCHLSER